MASLLSQLIIKIGADISPMDKALASATRKIQGFTRDVTSVGVSLAAGLSAPLIAFGAAAVNATAEMGALRAGLTAIAGSSAEAEKQMVRLKEIAKLPGLGLPEAVQGSVRLQAIGYQAAEAERILKVFGNAIATVGGGRAELAGVITQLQQMGAKSKVTADDLKPIINNVPMVGKVLKDLYGTIDSEAIQKMGIAPKQLIGDVLTELEKLAPVSGGLKNSLENFRDSATQAFDQAGQALAPFVEQFLNDFASPALEKLVELAKGFRDLSAPMQNAAIGAAALATAGPLIAIGLAQTISALVVLRGALATTGALMMTTFGPAGIAIAAATAAMYALGEGIQWVYRKLKEMGTLSAQELAPKLGPSVDAAKQLGVNIYETANAAKVFTPAVDEATKGGRKFGQAIKDFVLPQFVGMANAAEITRRYLAELNTEWNKSAEIAAKQAVLMKQGRLVIFDDDAISKAEEMARSLEHSAESIKKIKIGVDGVPDPIRDAATDAEELRKILERTHDPLGKNRKVLEDTGKITKQTLEEVSTIFTDMSRGIADAIINWKGFGDVAMQTLKSIGEAILRNLIQNLMKSSGLMDKVLAGLGKVLGKIPGLGGVGSAAGSAAGSVGSAAGGAGSIGGSAASGIMGTVGAVGAVVGAVSGIIGNFQMAGMNKSLDLIEKEVRYSQIHLLHLLEKANEFWPWLKFSHDRLATMLTQGLGVYNAPGDQGLRIAGGGGSGVNVNITGGMIFAPGGNRQFIDWLVGELRLAGAIR